MRGELRELSYSVLFLHKKKDPEDYQFEYWISVPTVITLGIYKLGSFLGCPHREFQIPFLSLLLCISPSCSSVAILLSTARPLVASHRQQLLPIPCWLSALLPLSCSRL